MFHFYIIVLLTLFWEFILVVFTKGEESLCLVRWFGLLTPQLFAGTIFAISTSSLSPDNALKTNYPPEEEFEITVSLQQETKWAKYE